MEGRGGGGEEGKAGKRRKGVMQSIMARKTNNRTILSNNKDAHSTSATQSLKTQQIHTCTNKHKQIQTDKERYKDTKR